MTDPRPVIEIAWGAATDPGGRAHNEDRYLAARPVFSVADGMGGNRGGELASTQVIAALEPMAGREWLDPAELDLAIVEAAHVLARLGDGRGAPGSTLAGVGLVDSVGRPCWLVFNIGDSRVYLLQGERLEQVSTDHSLVQEHAAADDAAQATRVPRNLITRAIGAGQPGVPEPDRWLLPARTGDRLLICSDGLTGELTDHLIAATLLACDDPQVCAQELVRTAVEAGARDNVTVVVVDAVAVSTGAGDLEPPSMPDLVEMTVPGEERHDG
ncbi:MAG: protein phosphatase 2C domain-containing protein [Propionibacteriaceae bacterium]|nr:protein phosphatase 2C domain-containing protein [Propionibacteriaceae bacterium]